MLLNVFITDISQLIRNATGKILPVSY